MGNLMKETLASIPKEFVTQTQQYDFKDPVSEVLSTIEKSGAVVVTKNGKYYGIVDDRSATKTNLLAKATSIGKLATQAPVLTKDSEIKDAISMFYASKTKALPFQDNGRIKGIVKRASVLKAMLSMHLLSTLKVDDIMSTPIIAIDQESSIEHARTAMKENNVNRLAVLDRGKFYGIISAKDLMQYGIKTGTRAPEFVGSSAKHTKVGEICQMNPHTIEYGSQADDAIREFIEKNISSLPVIRKGRPVGIITVRDAFETIVKNTNVQRRNIVVSGLDEFTKEMEDDIMAELESLADKIDRFRGAKVDYIALNIKPVKSKEYELRARLGLVKGGIISIYVYGYSLEATLKDLVAKMYREAKSKRDIAMVGRQV